MNDDARAIVCIMCCVIFGVIAVVLMGEYNEHEEKMLKLKCPAVQESK